MKGIRQSILKTTLFFTISLLCLFSFSSCIVTQTTSPGKSHGTNAIIDWVDFIKFAGITYLAQSSGNPLKETALGPQWNTIKHRLEGNVDDPAYQSQDGDAAFLNAGTRVYTVKGYRPTFRLATYTNRGIILFEADSNPRAKKGADLLDIGEKVRYIGINSDQNENIELAAIKDNATVSPLITMILEASVNQRNMSVGNKRYVLVFRLLDGTVVKSMYHVDTGELARGIMLPQDFRRAIDQAAGK